MWNRSYIPWNVAGILVAVIGFIIGSTKGLGGGSDTVTTVAAVLGTLGAVLAVVAFVLEVLRRRRISR